MWIKFENKFILSSNKVVDLGTLFKIFVYDDIDFVEHRLNINAFREYKPFNKNYNFFIIKPDFDKILFKINKFL